MVAREGELAAKLPDGNVSTFRPVTFAYARDLVGNVVIRQVGIRNYAGLPGEFLLSGTSYA